MADGNDALPSAFFYLQNNRDPSFAWRFSSHHGGKMKRLRFIVAALSVAIPLTAVAQVANGDFSAGFGSWSARDAGFTPSYGMSCLNANYKSTTKNTGKKGTAPAAGAVAQITPFIIYAPGQWTMCRQLEQSVYVPTGKQLKFDLRLGDGVGSAPYPFESAAVSVLVVDGAQTSTLFTQKGSSIVCGNGQLPCPIYRSQVVDMSPYWGKTVRLVFMGTSGVWNGQSGGITEPTYAYLDNVRID